MKIDENTKVILRLHKKANNRGLNIYNPFFQKSEINALYFLRHNPDPKPLLDGMRSLNISGAIPAGFEGDEEFVDLLDDLTEEAKFLNRVGVVFNDNGKLVGHYQGGIGLYNSIFTKHGSLENKEIVLLGAGTVAKGFLLELRKRKVSCKVVVVNRTFSSAESLMDDFNDIVFDSKHLSELNRLNGDIFIDTTHIGSPWNDGEELIYKEEFLQNFSFVADVTFVPTEPQLIKLANRLDINNAPGHRMFLYQAEECMKRILGNQEYDLDLYEQIMIEDFKVNWS